MSVVIDGTTGITSPDVDSPLNGLAYPDASSIGFRNRIINGDMRIDQRNNGASVTVNAATAFYASDRFAAQGMASSGVYTIQRSSVAPAGFNNSLLATVTTIDSSLAAGDTYAISQAIEGFNVADLGFGAVGAQAVTLSFWVRSSVTGTFGGALTNNNLTRSYAFTYTVSSANTWEQKTVTITGDTTGTWTTDNSAGLRVYWGLGVGSTLSISAGSWQGAGAVSATGATNLMATNGATFFITGAQLEAGSVATPFERRDYGRELIMCQRYAWRCEQYIGNTTTPANVGTQSVSYPVQMRAAPTLAAGAAFVVSAGSAGTPTIFIGPAVPASPNSQLIYNIANNWSVVASVQLNATFTAEL
jgi:hypothetical protein